MPVAVSSFGDVWRSQDTNDLCFGMFIYVICLSRLNSHSWILPQPSPYRRQWKIWETHTRPCDVCTKLYYCSWSVSRNWRTNPVLMVSFIQITWVRFICIVWDRIFMMNIHCMHIPSACSVIEYHAIWKCACVYSFLYLDSVYKLPLVYD